MAIKRYSWITPTGTLVNLTIIQGAAITSERHVWKCLKADRGTTMTVRLNGVTCANMTSRICHSTTHGKNIGRLQ